jgi:hypothetical protein
MTLNDITRKHLAAASPTTIALGMLAFSAAPAFADSCSLSGTPSVWSDANGNWNIAGNWTPSGVPGSGASVCIVDNTSTVSLNVGATVGNLQIASGNTLIIQTQLNLDSGGTFANSGLITMPNTTLQLNGSATLTGGGTVQM